MVITEQNEVIPSPTCYIYGSTQGPQAQGWLQKREWKTSKV